MELPQFPARPDCKLCDLHTVCTTPGIPSRWAEWSLPPSPTTPALFILGQNPNLKEDRAGSCFVGAPGNLLRVAYIGDHTSSDVRAHGLGLDKLATIYLGNVARCATYGEHKPANRHYRACSSFLLQDFALLPPSSRLIFLLLGGPAATHFFKLIGPLPDGTKIETITDAINSAGSLLTLPSGVSAQFFATYHPAYVLRKQAIFSAVIDHLRLLHDSLTGLSATPSSPVIVPPSPPPPRSSS